MNNLTDKYGTHHWPYCKNVDRLDEAIEPEPDGWGRPGAMRARCLGCGVIRHYVASDAA